MHDVREFDITGRAMRGWVMVGPAATADDGDLDGWLEQAMSYVSKLPIKPSKGRKNARSRPKTR
jgi:hypothetical protein